MEIRKLFDYVVDESPETGLTIAIVMSESEEGEIKDKGFIPKSIENRETSVRRIATYVSWYTEFAHLYIEESGADIEYMTKILRNLKEAGLDPYEFREIGYRSPGKIEIEEIPDGYKVVDKEREIFFSTDSSSNPQELN